MTMLPSKVYWFLNAALKWVPGTPCVIYICIIFEDKIRNWKLERKVRKHENIYRA
jgi:hypothetical protein